MPLWCGRQTSRPVNTTTPVSQRAVKIAGMTASVGGNALALRRYDLGRLEQGRESEA
jgi:hypothetical protein